MGPVRKENADYKKDSPTSTWKDWKKYKTEKKKKKHEKLIESLEDAKLKAEEEAAKKPVEVEEAQEPEICPGKTWTVSIALPGNILDNAQTRELQTLLAGQIARAIAIFNVDEVVIFDEQGSLDSVSKQTDDEEIGTDMPSSCLLMARILQYLECPQYLRKYFFPIHTDFQFVGLLNPLDAPNHYRRDDKAQFREGYVLEKVKKNTGSMVDVGLTRPIPADTMLTPGLRVTVEIQEPADGNRKYIKGKIVSPSTPQLKTGTYWGYSVRLAHSLGSVFTQCPYEEGYDLLIGTSERGTAIPKKLSKFNHALIAFGGLSGLELGLESDDSLTADDPSLLFDYYLNTCPNQGSRTIRTEEALLVTLSALKPVINRSQK